MTRCLLNAEELAELNKFDLTGHGGFQDFFRSLQARAAKGCIDLSQPDIERISRYAFDYGNGGWQTRLLRVFGRTLGRDLGRSALAPAPQQTELL